MRKFEQTLPMMLLMAREAVMAKFTPMLRENDLSVQQWRVLRILNDSNNLVATDLSSRSYLMMPSLSRILKNLESRGFIKRTIDDKDQRRSIISITSTGKELVKRLLPQSKNRYDHIETVLGTEKLHDLQELLEETIELLQSPEKQEVPEEAKQSRS